MAWNKFSAFNQFAGADEPASGGNGLPVDPITAPMYQEGFVRSVVNRAAFLPKPSTMAWDREYWIKIISTKDIPNWPTERYPWMIVSSTNHITATSSGGIWARVHDSNVGEVIDGNAWFEWDQVVDGTRVSDRPEFSHITRKVNPIFVGGKQTETPTPYVLNNELYIFYHIQDTTTRQSTYYKKSTNGIDFDLNGTGTLTSMPDDFENMIGTRHCGYFDFTGENPFDEIPYTYIGTCLQGGGADNNNSGQQIRVSNDLTHWEHWASWRRDSEELNNYNAAGEEDYSYPLENIVSARKEGSFYRVMVKYRATTFGDNLSPTINSEVLVDSDFNAVSVPKPFFPLGQEGDFDVDGAETFCEFEYNNKTYLFYTTTPESGESTVGLAEIEDVPTTWEIIRGRSSKAKVISAASSFGSTASGVNYSVTPEAYDEGTFSFTSLPLAINESESKASTIAGIAPNLNDITEYKFNAIGKQSEGSIELEFGITDNPDNPTSKLSFLFLSSNANGSTDDAIILKRLGTSVTTDLNINQLQGLTGTGVEKIRAKHHLGLRLIPAQNKLQVLSGSTVLEEVSVTGLDYSLDYSMFIRAKYDNASAAEVGYVAFSKMEVLTHSAEAAAVPDAPTLTTAKTTDSITLTASAVSGATSYKYFLNDIEQDNGVFTGLIEGETYTVYTRASNSIGDSAPSAIETVTTGPDLPVNTAPTANAGTNQTLAADIQGQLSGSGTVTTAGATITGYQWIAPAGITLNGANTANPTFTTPQLNVATTFTFSLVVTDSNGLTSVADTVDVVVEAYSPPVQTDSSALVLNVPTANGQYNVHLHTKEDGNEVVFDGVVTFNNGGATIQLDIDDGILLTGDATPVSNPTEFNSFGIWGVTQ